MPPILLKPISRCALRLAMRPPEAVKRTLLAQAEVLATRSARVRASMLGDAPAVRCRRRCPPSGSLGWPMLC
eukprot:5203990-Alexandrium_andersonii.AAC.1